LFRKTVPSKERAEVNINDFQGAQVLEAMQWDGGIKRKFFITPNQASPVVRSQA
jgi:hypothetical protein